MKNLYQELPLLQHASMSKPAMAESLSSRSSSISSANTNANTSSSSRKTVRFDYRHCQSRNVQSHRDYSPLEHRSVWYTPNEYGTFALNEVREKMSMPLDQRKEKHKRMLRIDNVRRTVLKSQSYQLLESRMPNTGNEYSEWLANYVQQHSEQSAAEARQRGIENDLELLDIKMQEMASRITKRQPISTKTQKNLQSTSKNSEMNKNERWSSNDLKDVAPTAIERSSTLRIELCKDFCHDKSIGGTLIKERRVHPRRRGRRGSIRLYNTSS